MLSVHFLHCDGKYLPLIPVLCHDQRNILVENARTCVVVLGTDCVASSGAPVGDRHMRWYVEMERLVIQV